MVSFSTGLAVLRHTKNSSLTQKRLWTISIEVTNIKMMFLNPNAKICSQSQ